MAFVDEPLRVTAAQMDRWCSDFDNWGIVDTVFQTIRPDTHAWKSLAMSKRWMISRAAFALLACLGVHEKEATNEQFLACLPLIEEASTDERNFVKKGVSWALRVIGRRNAELHNSCVGLAEGLASSMNPTARSLGKEALREFKSAVVMRQLKKRPARIKEVKLVEG